MRKHEQETSHGTDKYLLLEVGELLSTFEEYKTGIEKFVRFGAKWTNANSADHLRRCISTGDEKLVAASDEFLSKIENLVPMSRGWRNVEDVVGALPNVPAFLAGHPQHMRRRERVSTRTAPLAIFMDLTSSGMIDAKDVQRRGTVLLALTRMLVEHRPVELWVGVALGNLGASGTVAWKIDTAPLDLARAAYHVSATAMSRVFGYGTAQRAHGVGGAWPFNNYGAHVQTAHERLTTVFSGQELMYVSPIYGTDPLTRDPVAWIKRTLKQYAGVEVENAA